MRESPNNRFRLTSSLAAMSPAAMSFAALLLVLVTAASLAVAQNREPGGSAANVRPSVPATRDTTPPPSPGAGGNAKSTERLREGTRLLDVTGVLASVGADSVTFAPEGSKESFRVLENLALQRVVQVLDDNRGPRKWVISGLITEYRGSNYLLLTKVQQHDVDSAAGQ